MQRTLAVLATAMALAVAGTMPTDVVAQEKKAKAVKSVKVGKDQKVCRSKQPSGAVKTWICRKDQPCCVSHTFNLYTCGSQLLRCL